MIATTINVPIPPLTTEKIGVESAATDPDSNRPNSFDMLMNMPLTADTRSASRRASAA
jgi:hypothetical protein